jgi:uncharacterized protein
VDRFQEMLYHWVPFDASKGEEGVTAQGALLIGLLVLVGLVAWRGLNNVTDGITGWSWAALGLVGLTLLVAALRMTPTAHGLVVAVTGKAIGVLLAVGGLAWLLRRGLDTQEVQDWMWESWRFVKQIFPLLVAGVFVVGMIRVLIRPEWIQALAGENSLTGNLAGVVFGVFMYFPTLVEVPIASMFLDLGMHRGPLLAYLMADPELSLQSILIISAIIGRRKAWTYVGWVALFSTLAGLIYGGWVDGVPFGWLSLALAALVGTLATVLWLVNRHNAHRPVGLGASHS